MTDMPARVSLREVGPRDGLQNEDPVPTDGKVALLDALSQTGVRRIEAVSFVHPKAIPQMADADEVWARIAKNPEVRYSALVPNVRGAERALAAGFSEIEVVISASTTHNQRNINRTTDESLADLPDLASLVHLPNDHVKEAFPALTRTTDSAKGGKALQGPVRAGTLQVIVSTAWGCPYEGDVPVSRVVDVVRRAVAAGADSVAFGDTTGMATPGRVTELVGEVRSAQPDVPLGVHFHNTRGTGLANVLAALQMGVADFDASVGGLGGCPYAPGASGNIASEEFVHMLHDMGIETGVDLDALIEVAEQAEKLVGHQLPSQVLRAGPRTRLTPK